MARLSLAAAAWIAALALAAPAQAAAAANEEQFVATRVGSASERPIPWAPKSTFDRLRTATATGEFSVTDDPCSGRPVLGCSITVTFRPTGVGRREGTLTLVGDHETATLRLVGYGYVNGPAARAPAVVAFPVYPITVDVPIRNAGDRPLVVSKTSIKRASGIFRIADDGCSHVTVAPGHSCIIRVRSDAAGCVYLVAELRTSSADGALQSVTNLRYAQRCGSNPGPDVATEDQKLGWRGAKITLGLARHNELRLRLLSAAFPARYTLTVERRAQKIVRTGRLLAQKTATVSVRQRFVRGGQYRVTVSAVARVNGHDSLVATSLTVWIPR